MNKIYSHLSSLIIIITVITFAFIPANMWLDEAALGFNILQNDFFQFFKPLEYFNQVAPIGFLIFNKVICEIFGYSDFTMRIPSIVAFILSFTLLLKNSFFHNKFQLIMVIFLLSKWMFYGFELKQYIFDFLSLTVFYYQYYNRIKFDWRFVLIYALLGWFSNIAMFLLPVLVLFQLIIIKKRFGLKSLLGMLLLGLNSLSYFWLFVRGHPAKKVMNVYWSKHFIPLSVSDFPEWIAEHLLLFFNFHINTPFQYLRISLGLFIATLLLISLLILVRNDHLISTLKRYRILLIPFVFSLVMAVLKFYPLDGGRLSIYLIVPLIFLLYKVINFLGRYYKLFFLKRIKVFLFLLVISLSFSRIWYVKILYPAEDMRDYIANNSNDELVIFTGSGIKHYSFYKGLRDYKNEKTSAVYIRSISDTLNLISYDSLKYLLIVEVFSRNLEENSPATISTLDGRSFTFETVSESKGIKSYKYKYSKSSRR